MTANVQHTHLFVYSILFSYAYCNLAAGHIGATSRRARVTCPAKTHTEPTSRKLISAAHFPLRRFRVAMQASRQNICTARTDTPCMHEVMSGGSIKSHRLSNTSARYLHRGPLARHRCPRTLVVEAFNGDSKGNAVGAGGGGLRGGLDPSLEMAVPSEQRPVNELASLRQSALYSWVRLHVLGLQHPTFGQMCPLFTRI